MDAHSTDIDAADEAKWEQADAAYDQQQEESGMKIRERDDYDDLPDLPDPSYVEAQIIERIKHSSDEVNTVNSVVKTMVTHMLSRWGIAADQHRISVDIRVDGVDEWITWIDAKRQPVDYFIVALNAPSDPAIVNFDSPAIIGCNSMEVHAPGGFRMTIVGAETEEA